jgi:hypothetical protein
VAFAYVHKSPPAAVLSPPQQKQRPAIPFDASVATLAPVAKAAQLVSTKVADAHRNPHPAPPETKPASSCALNSTDIASELSIADARLQNRQYKEAERRFRAVLACQPENSHAASGVERARTALQLQPPSNP